MTDLSQDTIEAIHKISEAIKDTNFELNKFSVSDTAIESRQMINLDIRRKDFVKSEVSE